MKERYQEVSWEFFSTATATRSPRAAMRGIREVADGPCQRRSLVSETNEGKAEGEGN
jgi:hypothetical protein